MGKEEEKRGKDSRDVVLLEEAVLDALTHTHAGLGLLVEHTEGEGEAAGLLGDLGEGRARGLHLEEVGGARLLVDGRPRLVLLGLLLRQKIVVSYGATREE